MPPDDIDTLCFSSEQLLFKNELRGQSHALFRVPAADGITLDIKRYQV